MKPTTSANSTDWSQRLLHLLEQQQALLTRLRELAERQGELIRAQRTESLLNVLAERQQIIDRFLATQPDLHSLTDNLDQRLDELEPSRREQIRALLAEIETALDTVMRVDEQDRAALQANRDATRRELGDLGAARQARRAYLGASGASGGSGLGPFNSDAGDRTTPGNPRFADRQG